MSRREDDTLISPEQPPQVPPLVEGATLPLGRQRAGPASLEDAPRGAPPSRVGDYVIETVLAEGGFGVVYRARDAATGEPAAIKILHAELTAHPDVLVRFEREVEVIQRIRHPNVIEVRARGRLDDGRPYFVMELLAGSSLEDHLRARGRLPEDETLAILGPLCSALEAAHGQGIVHRDIKPSNVFLGEAGGRRRVVLLDFGVAKLLDAPGPSLTASHHIVGTLICTAPEQLLGRAIDARTDVYALGALAHTMLTGEPPFTERSLPVLRQLHLHAAPPRPSARARVSPAIDEVVLRALRKKPAERQPGAAAFLAELRAAMAHSHGAARGPGEQRAAAVYVEVRADAALLEEPDEPLLADLEAILPAAAAALADAGFAAALESGTCLLAVAPLPAGPEGDAGRRRGALEAAQALSSRIQARAGRDERVRVRICVHAGAVLRGGDGAFAGGELLELSGWVSDADAAGLFATAQALESLDIDARPDAAGDRLLRVSF
jgi:serine/threonine-protein kinase